MKIVEFSFRGGEYRVIKEENGELEILDKEGTFVGSFLNSNIFLISLFSDLDDKETNLSQEDYDTLFSLLESL